MTDQDEADRLACGIEILKAVEAQDDLSIVKTLVQAALDFLTNDEEALAEGRLWQLTDEAPQ